MLSLIRQEDCEGNALCRLIAEHYYPFGFHFSLFAISEGGWIMTFIRSMWLYV